MHPHNRRTILIMIAAVVILVAYGVFIGRQGG